VIVNLTNDGWFWGSSELDMHLVAAIFRAVEVRTPIVIAANTGFSAAIDGCGRLLARGPRRATAPVRAGVQPDGRTSPWLVAGSVAAGLCVAIAGAVLLEALVRGWGGACGATRARKPPSGLEAH
jgi:apolipoprotein N-acyltransferase